jgi:spermidine synthase
MHERHLDRGTYAGVFVVAASTLVLEILMTRITSVVAWYHLAFFVISLAMLGMTAGAVIVFVQPVRFAAERVPERLVQGCLALAIATPVAVAAALSIPLGPITSTQGFLAMLGYGGALAVPFTISGVVLTLALTRAGLPPGRVYGVDLVGAAAGCVLVIPLLAVVDAPSATFVAGAGAALAGLCFASARTDSGAAKARRRAAIVAVLLAVGGILNANAGDPLVRPRWVKGWPEIPELYAYSGWTTYSRVTVDKTVDAPPLLWAPSRTMPPELGVPIPQRGIKIDGAAGTTMAALDTDPTDDRPGSAEMHAYLEWDVTSFAHLLRPDGPAAVIGVGGGRDVVEAVRVGHDPVVGIELNDLIVRLHEETMRDFSGIVDLPGVELVADEARSYLARDERRYQVITMSLIDTWAATGAGAYALSENGLYTVEGWRIFMSRLDAGGIFTVSRWYKPDSPGETARMLALAMETLWRMGAEDPRRHVMMLQNQNIATLLVCRDPFTAADIDRLQKEAVMRGYNMLLTPRKMPVNPMLRALAERSDRAEMWRWASSQVLDFTPPTDERPFFFNMLRPGTWLASGETKSDLDYAFLGNLHATQTLVYATLASALLTVLAILGPLWTRRRSLAGIPALQLLAACLYFALIGLGFMFVEMGLLSRLNVFLGHPTLALAVLLGGIILFTGIGSLASGRLDPTRPRVALLYPLVPAVLVLGVALVLDPAMHRFAAASTGLRVVIGIALVATPALGLGLGFPLGLRLVERLRADLGPWMWGVNGACGVVASGLALTSSMAWGISVTLRIGAACYVALIVCTALLSRAGRRPA